MIECGTIGGLLTTSGTNRKQKPVYLFLFCMSAKVSVTIILDDTVYKTGCNMNLNAGCVN